MMCVLCTMSGAITTALTHVDGPGPLRSGTMTQKIVAGAVAERH
jgi:hypothetical protein